MNSSIEERIKLRYFSDIIFYAAGEIITLR